jgi:PAS domain S-box-containing protein
MENSNQISGAPSDDLSRARERISVLERLLSDQKEAEKTLRLNCEHFRNLAENTSDWIWETDAELHYIYAGSKIRDMLGYSPEEVLGKLPTDLMTPEDAARFAPLISDIKATPRACEGVENKNLHKDGSIRFLETSFIPLYDPEGRFSGYRGIDRDITARKQEQEQLERYRTFLENIGEACFEFDFHDKCTFLNEAAHRIIGYTHDEYMTLKHRQRHPTQKDADLGLDVLKRIYRTGAPSGFYESNVLCKDGSVITMELSISLIRDNQGKPIGFRGVGRDITARKKEQMELERYRDFMENIADGCVEIDLQSKVTYANDVAARRLGLTREQMIGLKNTQYTTAEEAERINKIYADIYRTGIPALVENYEVHDENGQVRFIEMSASLIRDAQGKPVGFRGTTRDVTEKKAIQDALKASEENYRLLIENSPIGIVVHSADGRIVMSNRRAQEFFEMTEEQMTGQPADQELWKLLRPDGSMMPPEEYPVHLAITNNAPVNDLLCGIDRPQSGYTAWYLVNAQPQKNQDGRLVRVIVSFMDITLRRQALQELAKSEAKYRFLTEKMSDVVWTVDTNLMTTYVSPSIEATLGYTQEEMMGRSPRDILAPESDPLAMEFLSGEWNRFKEESSPSRQSITFEGLFHHKNGSSVWLEVVVSPIRDESGTLIGYHGVSRNITAQKRAAEEKERFIEELRKALAEVKKLSGMLPICSHCKKIRDDSGYWNQLEGYITEHSEALFSHCVCPDCAQKLYAAYLPKKGR